MFECGGRRERIQRTALTPQTWLTHYDHHERRSTQQMLNKNETIKNTQNTQALLRKTNKRKQVLRRTRNSHLDRILNITVITTTPRIQTRR